MAETQTVSLELENKIQSQGIGFVSNVQGLKIILKYGKYDYQIMARKTCYKVCRIKKADGTTEKMFDVPTLKASDMYKENKKAFKKALMNIVSNI